MESELRLEAMKRVIRDGEDIDALKQDFEHALAHLVHKEFYLKQAIIHIARLEGEEPEDEVFGGLTDNPRAHK
jgi:hypothetical protein